jgi:hypothetical protein
MKYMAINKDSSTDMSFVNRQGNLVHPEREGYNARKSARVGIAYAFLDYEGRWTELVGHLGMYKDIAKFPDTFRVFVLNDSLSPMNSNARFREMYGHEMGRLPEKIIHNSKYSEVIPGKATDYRYLIRAHATVSNSDSPRPLAQGKANLRTARMLTELLNHLVEGEHKMGAGTRRAVFFIDGQRMSQRYI